MASMRRLLTRSCSMTPWGKILTSKEMRARANMSAPTEWRLARAGMGPPRIKLSPKRWGYPEDLFNAWLQAALSGRSSQPRHQPRLLPLKTKGPPCCTSGRAFFS
jgi:predicted DNA-binding transcriptional regulator AlpA